MARLLHQALDKPLLPSSYVHSKSGLRWSLIGIIVVGLVAILIVKKQKDMSFDQAQSVNNIRQLGLALFEFETEYGSFPDETTIDVVKANTRTDLSLGKETSNDFFRQLIASGIATNESMFYAGISGSKKPDNRMDGVHALEKGEVGYAWFRGGSLKRSPGRPLIAAPMIPGTDRFDPKPFQGRAIILKMDNSLGWLHIDENGHAILDGRNMMDPHHPVWGGSAPVIAWPDL